MQQQIAGMEEREAERLKNPQSTPENQTYFFRATMPKKAKK